MKNRIINNIQWYSQQTDEGWIDCETVDLIFPSGNWDQLGYYVLDEYTNSYGLIFTYIKKKSPVFYKVSCILPKAEYIERKFDAFVLALKPFADAKHTRELTNEREYFIKLTPDKIQNWWEIPKQELLDLTVPELVAKYTTLKHEKERVYGM